MNLKRLAWAACVSLASLQAHASLDVGERAPDFTATAALAGKTYTFSLKDSLAKGPVVLYFFPVAFSEGCSIEAHSFAESIGQFEALGATVIGVSSDDIETLSRFSVQACQNKFPVASDGGRNIIKAYDAAMQTRPEFANRVSYVITPDASIAYCYVSLNPDKHVERTLGALRKWAQVKQPK